MTDKSGQETEKQETEAETEVAETTEVEAASKAAEEAAQAARAAEETAQPAQGEEAVPAAEEAAAPAEADAASPADEETQPAAAEPGESPRPELPEVLSWAGHKLDEMQGATVGRVDGAYVDDAGGKPEWLLVRLGRFGHHTLVPGRYAVAAAGRVWVPFARDVIRRAPRIKAGSPLTRDEESALLAHYGIAAPNGRSGEIAEREAGAVTARPAS